MIELYSYEKYRGYDLFVEDAASISENLDDEEDGMYEGVAQKNGVTVFTSTSVNGKDAEHYLMVKIDKELINE
jgi:hypothetical protein